MQSIRIVEATGYGPTAQSAFDAALAHAGVERYNLITLSSVIPDDADISVVESVPEIGTTGHLLAVVMARTTVAPSERGAAGLAWARTETGEGIFYEAAANGPNATDTVHYELDAGINHGIELRGWNIEHGDRLVSAVTGTDDQVGCSAVIAAYGAAKSPWTFS